MLLNTYIWFPPRNIVFGVRQHKKPELGWRPPLVVSQPASRFGKLLWFTYTVVSLAHKYGMGWVTRLVLSKAGAGKPSPTTCFPITC